MAGEENLQVMSYNIKYATEEDGENSWSKRKTHLKDLISLYNPDILGVQEARLSQLQFLEEQLKNFTYFGTGRDGGEKGLFNAIFYKKELFQVLEQATFWLSNTPLEPSIGWDAAYKRICTYGFLEHKNTGEKCWVFNTHFDHQGKQAVKESAELIIKKIAAENTGDDPVIVMGDFNLEPQDLPVQYLAKILNDSKQVAREVAPGPEETFNAYEFHEEPIGRFDYIFVNEKVEVQKYAVLTEANEEKYPSDHFPVLVKLVFKKK